MKSIVNHYCILVVVLLAFSCQQTEFSLPPRRETLKLNLLRSGRFRNISINVSALDMNNAKFITVDEKALYIRFNNIVDDRKGVIVLVDNFNSVKGVMAFEVITSTSTAQLEETLKAGQFRGTFRFFSEFGDFEFQMERSKIVKRAIINSRIALEAPKCAGWTEIGGPLDCAGARLEQMNLIDKAFCYATFVPCMAQLVASCIYDNCEVNPKQTTQQS